MRCFYDCLGSPDQFTCRGLRLKQSEMWNGLFDWACLCIMTCLWCDKWIIRFQHFQFPIAMFNLIIIAYSKYDSKYFINWNRWLSKRSMGMEYEKKIKRRTHNSQNVMLWYRWLITFTEDYGIWLHILISDELSVTEARDQLIAQSHNRWTLTNSTYDFQNVSLDQVKAKHECLTESTRALSS